jgi:hypothetical protein
VRSIACRLFDQYQQAENLVRTLSRQAPERQRAICNIDPRQLGQSAARYDFV